jgi:hypothetical protein
MMLGSVLVSSGTENNEERERESLKLRGHKTVNGSKFRGNAF